MNTAHFLHAALAPRSIALVGASERPGALGTAVYANLLAGGYQGQIYAVNPKHARIAGHPCFPTLEALPEVPDLAVIATPPATLPALVEAAARRRIGALLVLSGGFAASGSAGRTLQKRMLDAARRHRIRLLGPDCLGLMRPQIGLNATSARSAARPGTVALVSQSGAVVAAMLDYAWSAGFGFSSVIATGAGSEVEFAQILDFLAGDGATRSIVLYLEGVDDGRGFVSSVRAAASVKPVVVLKAGRHVAAGAAAGRETIAAIAAIGAIGSIGAVGHAGALVGDDRVFDAALRRAGALRVKQYEELLIAAETLAGGRLPRGNRLAILSNGRGPGALAADAADDCGIALAGLSAGARTALAALVAHLAPAAPAADPLAPASLANPVDIGGAADSQRVGSALDALIADGDNDGVLVLFTPTRQLDARAAAACVLPLVAATDKPVVTAWLGHDAAGQGRALCKEARIPALSTPEGGVEAFGYLAGFVHNRRLRLQVPPPQVDELSVDLQAARALLDGLRRSGRTLLGEDDSKTLLAAFGIEIARGVRAHSADEARRCAAELGFPVVLKVRADGLVHKSEVGGVLLGLASGDAVAQGFDLIAARVAERAPRARFLGVLVQPMVQRPAGRELIVGLVRDPAFGPVITFGMGGIAVEVLSDTAVALPPLNRMLARELIDRTRVARMLGAFRGLPPVDGERLIDTLLRISELACELPCVRELDINPLLADDRGVIALDARVVVDEQPLAPDATYSHLAVHPYPKALERTAVLNDGTRLLLRPVRPEDVEADQRLVARLSPQSLYQRFHAPLRELSAERLARFFQIDYDREMALVAVEQVSAVHPVVENFPGAARPGIEEIRGVARYARNPDGLTAEFGLVVEDAWQGRGLGRALMSALEDCARSRAVVELIGYVLADNRQMAQLMDALGYRLRRDYADDPGVVAFAKALAPAPAAAAQPARKQP